MLENQAIDAGRDEDLDVIGRAEADDGRLVLYLLTIRRGKVIGGRPFVINDFGGGSDEVVAAFCQRHYEENLAAGRPPGVLLLPEEGPGTQVLGQWLARRRGAVVKIVVPQRGRRLQLLRLAQANARETLALQLEKPTAAASGPLDLARRLRLAGPLRVIEGMDISNLGADLCRRFPGGFPGWRRCGIRISPLSPGSAAAG